MATDNNITHFTAADIEKYHKGQLSAKQMHALEKAALDDPFLADALEGYAVAGVNISADLAMLKQQLAERVEDKGAKLVAMTGAPPRSYRMLRAAVMILFIAGAGWLVYQFGFNKKSNDIARLDTNQTPVTNNTNTDTVKNPAATITKETDAIANADKKNGSGPTSTVVSNGEKTPTTTNETSHLVRSGTETGQNDQEMVDFKKPTPIAADDIATKKSVEQPAVTSIPKGADRNDNKTLNGAVSVERKNAAVKEEAHYDKYKYETETAAGVKDRLQNQQSNRNVTARRAADNNNNSFGYVTNQSNTFRGRVTDNDNNGVPFANVTNVQDNNAGTYTDARGYFNLTYPDSVLNVQVRSVGFENKEIQLRNSAPNNQVVMQEDRTLSAVVMPKQKVDANAPVKNRDANLKLETPEPADGWDNYNAYISNNLELPEDLKTKPTGSSGEVLVSFAVDRNGEPTDVKIEKSDCTQCNKEAIRLVKEGPKWKGKAKKGRTTVTIKF